MFNKIYEKIKQFIRENYKFILALLLVFALFSYELPVCIYTPGGSVNLENRIEVENGYESKGEFSMAYVSMVKSSIPFVLLSFVLPDWDLEKQEQATYENMSLEETIALDKMYMEQGYNNAILSAYHLVGKEVKIKQKKLKVIYIEKEAKTKLKINDEILAIDGYKVSSLSDIKNYLQNKEIEDEVLIKIKREGKDKEVKAKLINLNNEPKIGVATLEMYDLETEPEIKINTKKSESGSSGGLMMSLAIYNSLIKQDLTSGKKIIGTGTIDENGHVGKIDGVKYKLLGAEKKKAQLFLCPEENYEEAIEIKKKRNLKIEIVKVTTLQEAVAYLEKLGEE